MGISRGRRFLTGALLFIAGAAAAAAVAWAVVAVTTPAADPLEATDFTLVEVAPGEVGSRIQLNTVAHWRQTPAGANRASGVVTTVDADPETEALPGTILYTVDLRPVVIAQGTVPAFRDITDGSAGEDVRQVQQLLADLGFYHGEVGGEAGALTASAIRDWQESLGLERTGVVAAGDIVFVPTLPARITLDPEVVFRGASLSGGEAVVAELPASPEFTIPVTDAQAAMIPSGTRVEITSPQGDTWIASAGGQTRNAETATVSIALTGADGGTICAEACAQVPVTGESTLPSTIVTVETVAGLVVPSSALVTDAAGGLSVIDETGERRPVDVVAAARGMSVIDGVEGGTKVRVPGGTAP